MLHDLYLLACYFEPTMAVMYEEDLRRRYGAGALSKALQDGLLVSYRSPCLCEGGKPYYCLSQKGVELARIG